MSLKHMSDEQLTILAANAKKAGDRGSNVLGPRSLHAIAIEQNRRRCGGKRLEPRTHTRRCVARTNDA